MDTEMLIWVCIFDIFSNRNIEYVHRTIQSKSQNVGVKLFSNSVDLIVSCAIHLKDTYIRESLTLLIDLLDQINTIEEQKAGKDLDRIISDIIRGIEALCMADSAQVCYYILQIDISDWWCRKSYS
jgi:hypothetical protein